MHKFTSVKAREKLEKLARQRVRRLTRIAREFQANFPVRELMDIMIDNAKTDGQLQYYFEEGLLGMPSEVAELHVKRCEDSGVQECICMPDKAIVRGEIL